jgi:hypothetical protein
MAVEIAGCKPAAGLRHIGHCAFVYWGPRCKQQSWRRAHTTLVLDIGPRFVLYGSSGGSARTRGAPAFLRVSPGNLPQPFSQWHDKAVNRRAVPRGSMLFMTGSRFWVMWLGKEEFRR